MTYMSANQLAMQCAQSPIAWKPAAYMKKARKFLLEHNHAGLFMRPGLRKTSITLSAISQLKKEGKLRRALILAPLRVCQLVWPKEVKKWKQFSDLKIVLLHGPDKDRLLKEPADIYVMNFEGLTWLSGAKKQKTASSRKLVEIDVKRWLDLKFDTLVVDELSKFKHVSSDRFKLIKHLLPYFKRRWGLTGSPVANGYLDLFGQCYILDQGATLGRYITHYRSNYFLPADPFGWKWRLRRGADDEICKKISHFVLQMTDTDYLDMPELIINDVKITLPDDVYKVYAKLEEDLLTIVGKETIVASSAAVAKHKCRQIVNGGIYHDREPGAQSTEKKWSHVHSSKIDALTELIDELQGSPVLVAYEFEHDLEQIKSKLGDVPHIGGGVSHKRVIEIESDWNAGKLPILLGQISSMSHGLNLQESSQTIIFYSLTYDYDTYDQFIRRIYRSGNKHNSVIVHRIIAENTIDEVIAYNVLKSKENGQLSFYEALKQLAKNKK